MYGSKLCKPMSKVTDQWPRYALCCGHFMLYVTRALPGYASKFATLWLKSHLLASVVTICSTTHRLTVLSLYAAVVNRPADNTSFLPESPRPVVDRTIDYSRVPG